MTWRRSFRGRSWPKPSNPFIRNRKERAVGRSESSGCCASTFSSTGSTSRIRLPRRRCTTRARCAGLWALTWAGSPHRTKERDPEMHQTRKGRQWYFGMKAHIGVDSRSKLIHSVVVTPANVHDSRVLRDLLHGDETRVGGDSAYAGQKAVILEVATDAKDFTQVKGSRYRKLTESERSRNRNKSRVRAKVEHQFGIIKRQFGFTKVRYRGLSKNAHRLFVACALSNLVMAKQALLKRRRLELQATYA